MIELQQLIYLTLFCSGSLLVEDWKQRLAILIAASLFTVTPSIYYSLGVSEQDKLLWFMGAELIGAILLPILLKGFRGIAIFCVQMISYMYFLWEYIMWNTYSPTWQYYTLINTLLLDLTLAILVIKPKKLFTYIHFTACFIFSGLIWLQSLGYLNTQNLLALF